MARNIPFASGPSCERSTVASCDATSSLVKWRLALWSHLILQKFCEPQPLKRNAHIWLVVGFWCDWILLCSALSRHICWPWKEILHSIDILLQLVKSSICQAQVGWDSSSTFINIKCARVQFHVWTDPKAHKLLYLNILVSVARSPMNSNFVAPITNPLQ